DVALVPERECEQAPELAREVFLARHVPVEQAADGLRAEEALSPNGLGRQRLPRERLQLSPQPGGGRDREATLLAADDRVGQERADGRGYHHLLSQAAHALPFRGRVCEVLH